MTPKPYPAAMAGAPAMAAPLRSTTPRSTWASTAARLSSSSNPSMAPPSTPWRGVELPFLYLRSLSSSSSSPRTRTSSNTSKPLLIGHPPSLGPHCSSVKGTKQKQTYRPRGSSRRCAAQPSSVGRIGYITPMILIEDKGFN